MVATCLFMLDDLGNFLTLSVGKQSKGAVVNLEKNMMVLPGISLTAGPGTTKRPLKEELLYGLLSLCHFLLGFLLVIPMVGP